MRLKRWHVMLGIIHFMNFDSHAALKIKKKKLCFGKRIGSNFRATNRLTVCQGYAYTFILRKKIGISVPLEVRGAQWVLGS